MSFVCLFHWFDVYVWFLFCYFTCVCAHDGDIVNTISETLGYWEERTNARRLTTDRQYQVKKPTEKKYITKNVKRTERIKKKSAHTSTKQHIVCRLEHSKDS